MTGLIIGFTCPGCGLDASGLDCESCGGDVVWDRAQGSHCSACGQGAASIACRECGTQISLDRPGDATAPAAQADAPRTRPPESSRQPGLIMRLLAARRDRVRWAAVIGLSMLVHVTLVSVLLAGRPGSGGTIADDGDTAQRTVLVLDTGTFALPAFATADKLPTATDAGRFPTPVALPASLIDEPVERAPLASGIIVIPALPSPQADGVEVRGAPAASQTGSGRGTMLLPFDLAPVPSPPATAPAPAKPAPAASVRPATPQPAPAPIRRTTAPQPDWRAAYTPPPRVQPPQPKRTWLGRVLQSAGKPSISREGIYGDTGPSSASASSASAGGGAGGGGGGGGGAGGGGGGGGAGGGGGGGGGAGGGGGGGGGAGGGGGGGAGGGGGGGAGGGGGGGGSGK